MMDTKLPPCSIETEESVLASCLLNFFDLAKATDVISPDDFYRTAHQKIFQAMLDLLNAGKQADLVTVCEKLREREQIDEVGGGFYISKLTDQAPIASNIEQYCEILKNLSVKRKLISETSILNQRCYEHASTTQELLDQAQKMITDCETRSQDEQPVRASILCDDLIMQYENVNKSTSGITGLITGFDKLDRITGGLQKTDLIIVAGRPGMGKTAFALDIAKAAIDRGNAVLFESIEMSKEQLVSRLASKISKIDSVKLRTGGIGPPEWIKLMSAMSDISDYQLYVDSPKNNDFDNIRRKIRRAHRENKISLVIIDYLQLMFRHGDFGKRKDLEIGSITRDLKHLASDLQIPVILLSQLNRELEKRNDKRPVLSDLRESGAIEQDADLILFLYRDEVYNKDINNPNKGVGELIIGKHRHGPTGKAKLQWDEATATYRNFINYNEHEYRPPHKNQDLD